jgi:hypothetical protein
MSARQLEKNPSAVGSDHPGARSASHDDIAAARSRIAKAEKDRDAWKAAGSSEKYLEAYFFVEALELQLDTKLRALRSTRSRD